MRFQTFHVTSSAFASCGEMHAFDTRPVLQGCRIRRPGRHTFIPGNNPRAESRPHPCAELHRTAPPLVGNLDRFKPGLLHSGDHVRHTSCPRCSGHDGRFRFGRAVIIRARFRRLTCDIARRSPLARELALDSVGPEIASAGGQKVAWRRNSLASGRAAGR